MRAFFIFAFLSRPSVLMDVATFVYNFYREKEK